MIASLRMFTGPLQHTVNVQVSKGFLGGDAPFTAVSLSLDGLLQHKQNHSPEVKLIAELFQDMLNARYGTALLRSLACLEQQVRSTPVISSAIVHEPSLWVDAVRQTCEAD